MKVAAAHATMKTTKAAVESVHAMEAASEAVRAAVVTAMRMLAFGA